MASVTLKGNIVNTTGELPQDGSMARDFLLTDVNLDDKSLSDYSGKNIVLNIFPSIDTSACAASVREFNRRVSSFKNTVVLCVSKDLPFAQKRFCGAEGIENVITLSVLRNNDFGNDYGVLLKDGPLKGLLARSIVVIDDSGKVKYTQLVSEISDEPDYDSVAEILK